MIPNPILKVLSTMSEHRVRCLLMGGQACVFYGAAEFSRDSDFAVLARAHPLDAREVSRDRDLLSFALEGEQPAIRAALEAEERAERESDRAFWEPLKRELGEMRRNRP